MLVILSLLSSILSVTLTSEQNYPLFGKEPDKTKTKETKTKSKPTSKPKGEDKSKNDNSKTKDDNTTPKETDNKEIKNKESDIKESSSSTDTTASSTDKPTTIASTTEDPTTPSTTPSDTSTTLTLTPVTTDSQLTTSTIENPINHTLLVSTTPTTNENFTSSVKSLKIANPSQNNSTCEPSNDTCFSIDKTEFKSCPDGYNTIGNGECITVFDCDSSKYNNCPIKICHVDKDDCTKGLTCPNGYHRDGIKGDCKSHIPCDSSKLKCPADHCNLFKGDCLTIKICPQNSTNSTNTSCYPPKNDKPEEGSNNNINTQIIKEQVSQQSSNALIPIDTLQFCNQIGDQACVFANSNMKILFNQTTKDSFGNWLLNGEAQNIGSFTINNVRVVWHLYNALGNVIGLTQGFPTPSNLAIGQTTLFNLQIKATDLSGIPVLYRISFDFLS